MDKLLLHIDSVNLDFYIVDGGSKQDVIDYISEVFDNVPLNSVKTKLYCCDGGDIEIQSFRLEIGMSDSKFVESGNIHVYEYPNGAEIVKLSSKLDSFVEAYDDVIFVRTREEDFKLVNFKFVLTEVIND